MRNRSPEPACNTIDGVLADDCVAAPDAVEGVVNGIVADVASCEPAILLPLHKFPGRVDRHDLISQRGLSAAMPAEAMTATIAASGRVRAMSVILPEVSAFMPKGPRIFVSLRA